MCDNLREGASREPRVHEGANRMIHITHTKHKFDLIHPRCCPLYGTPKYYEKNFFIRSPLARVDSFDKTIFHKIFRVCPGKVFDEKILFLKLRSYIIDTI